MVDYFIEYSTRLLGLLFNPQKRIFIGYLLSAFFIAFVYLIFVKKLHIKSSYRVLFPFDVWLSTSSRSDYMVIAINQAIILLLSPYLLARLTLAALLFEYAHYVFDGRHIVILTLPSTLLAFLYTLFYFVIDDASKYLLHRALHRWEFLWVFHQTHHSAETLTPFTVHRIHPIESILYAIRATIVQASIISMAVFFFGNQLDMMMVIGTNIFIFIFNILGANIRHSHIPISYGAFFEKIFISPAQHQIHHSSDEKHYDKNFGAVLAIWDKIGNTLYLYDDKEFLTFGVDNTAIPSQQRHRLYHLYITPFITIWQLLSHKLSYMVLRYHR